jgi:large subunit ribosomal protein L10
MPSEKNIKSLETLSESFSRSTIIISTNYSGLSVENLTDLRRQLKKDSIDYKIAKKTLMSLAAEANDKPSIDSILDGPIGLALGYGEPTIPAKIISEFIRTNRSALSIQGGILGNRILTSDEVSKLATIPPKEELLSQLLMQMKAPVNNLVNVLSGPMRGLAMVLQGRVSQLSQS